jgi:predicted transcriptional regulator
MVAAAEGHTDLMYLIVLEQLSAHRKKAPFRPRFWMQPAGGAARIAAIAMFYHERKFRTFALFDKEPDAKEHVARLQEQGFPGEAILYCDTDGRDESDIEDLFTQDDYLRAVNELYLVVLRDAKFSRVTDADTDALRQADESLKRLVPTLESCGYRIRPMVGALLTRQRFAQRYLKLQRPTTSIHPKSHSLASRGCSRRCMQKPRRQFKSRRPDAQSARASECCGKGSVERLIGYDEWFVRQVEEGLAQIDRGEVHEQDEVAARMEKLIGEKQRRS